MRFTKMQGLGNDYVYLDCTQQVPKNVHDLARKLSDRHFGVGSDGLICIGRSDKADFRMDMYNVDGSQGEMCGNGIRCVGKFVYDKGMTDQTTVTIETLAGIRTLMLKADGGVVTSVAADMGVPILEPGLIPVTAQGRDFISKKIQVKGKSYEVTCVSMGNPHAVVFVPDVAGLNMEEIGPAFEYHTIFPRRINTEFLQIEGPDSLLMRVWERGSGETLACGTGACACLVAAVLSNRADREVTVRLRGGELAVRWDQEDGHVYMTGPAVTVFEGQWPEEI